MKAGSLILFALIASIVLSGCSSPAIKRKDSGSDRQLAENEKKETVTAGFNKARIVWNDDKGRTIMEARFSKADAEQTEDRAVVKLMNVSASLYQNGKLSSNLTAPWVEADSHAKEVKAHGGVKVTSVLNGGTAQSQEIVWKASENKVLGSGNVKMIRQNLTINAGTFVSDTALKNATFSDATMSLK